MTVEVLRAGPMTTIQDWPGRVGYWSVGVPPSGPMDDLSFRLANVAVGNPWTGDPDPSAPFHAQMKVDWVKAYQL